MQFETQVKCRVPGSDCPSHGVKTIVVPWAGPRSQFTLLFERFAIEILLGARSIKTAQEILRISWDQASAEKLWKTLPEEQREQIQAVALAGR